MVWIRRIAMVIGALVLVLVAAAAVLIATFDADRHKAVAIDWMRTEHQRTLAIDGPIELSVFPRLAVHVQGVRISERARNDEFIAADEVALVVQALPLLRQELVIDRVSGRGVRAAYRRDAGGVRNFDDLLTGPDAGTAPDGQPPRLTVRSVQLDDLRLRVHDDAIHAVGEVVAQSLSIDRLAHQAESTVSLRATVRLTQPQAVDLVLDGRMALVPDLDQGAVAVRLLNIGARGSVAGHGGLSLALDVGRATVDTRRPRLEVGALRVSIAARERADPFELSLDWPLLSVDAAAVGGSGVSGILRLGGSIPLVANFRSAAPTGTPDALRLPGLDVTAQGRAGQRTFEGRATADAVLDVSRRAAALERVQVRATLVDAGLQPLQLEMGGSAAADPATLRWALDGALDASRFASTGQASFTRDVPQMRADARIDSLDLNRLLPADRSSPAVAAAVDVPFPLEHLGALDGQFTLAVGKLAFRQVRLADVKVDATLDGGALQVARLTCTAWGGRFDASGSADSRTRRVAVKVAASGVAVDALLRDLAGKSPLEGTARVTADLVSSGRGVGEWRSNLAGSVSLQVRHGAIKGIDLVSAFRQAAVAPSRVQDAVRQVGEAERTGFLELSASARIAGGVARNDDLDVRTPLLRIGGSGQWDIGRGRIDYTARATVIASSAARDGGQGIAALRGTTVPIVLTGPVDAIVWKVQWADAAAAAVGRTLMDRIADELAGKPRVSRGDAGAASAPVPPTNPSLPEQLRRLMR